MSAGGADVAAESTWDLRKPKSRYPSPAGVDCMLIAEHLRAVDAEVLQRRAASALLRQGIGRGDRVVVVATTSSAMLGTILGALRVGIVPVVLNPALLPAEQIELIADAAPALVLRDDDLLRLLDDDDRVELAPVPLARPMHYTSGTTGKPKGVWCGVLDEAGATALVSEEREIWGFEQSDVHLVCSPLHHSAPLRFATGTLLAGGDLILLARFDAEAVLNELANGALTSMFCAPTHLQRLFARGPLPPLSSLRLIAHAGAPCSPKLKLQALEVFPTGTVWEFYGSTEGQFTVCAPEEWLERPGTVGRARRGRRLWLDSDDTIWCDVPDHARFDYWRAPEKTSTAWRGTSFTVGDLGRLDPDGYLFLDGRREDLVISGGVNVYPAEIEQVIGQLAGVAAAAVFGIDDERWGERVCAAVVGDVTRTDVISHCRAHLAPYKCPKDVYLVDELPITSTGKLLRSALADGLGLTSAPSSMVAREVPAEKAETGG